MNTLVLGLPLLGIVFAIFSSNFNNKKTFNKWVSWFFVMTHAILCYVFLSVEASIFSHDRIVKIVDLSYVFRDFATGNSFVMGLYKHDYVMLLITQLLFLILPLLYTSMNLNTLIFSIAYLLGFLLCVLQTSLYYFIAFDIIIFTIITIMISDLKNNVELLMRSVSTLFFSSFVIYFAFFVLNVPFFTFNEELFLKNLNLSNNATSNQFLIIVIFAYLIRIGIMPLLSNWRKLFNHLCTERCSTKNECSADWKLAIIVVDISSFVLLYRFIYPMLKHEIILHSQVLSIAVLIFVFLWTMAYFFKSDLLFDVTNIMPFANGIALFGVLMSIQNNLTYLFLFFLSALVLSNIIEIFKNKFISHKKIIFIQVMLILIFLNFVGNPYSCYYKSFLDIVTNTNTIPLIYVVILISSFFMIFLSFVKDSFGFFKAKTETCEHKIATTRMVEIVPFITIFVMLIILLFSGNLVIDLLSNTTESYFTITRASMGNL